MRVTPLLGFSTGAGLSSKIVIAVVFSFRASYCNLNKIQKSSSACRTWQVTGSEKGILKTLSLVLCSKVQAIKACLLGVIFHP